MSALNLLVLRMAMRKQLVGELAPLRKERVQQIIHWREWAQRRRTIDNAAHSLGAQSGGGGEWSGGKDFIVWSAARIERRPARPNTDHTLQGPISRPVMLRYFCAWRPDKPPAELPLTDQLEVTEPLTS
jgi:hypothetical protein